MNLRATFDTLLHYIFAQHTNSKILLCAIATGGLLINNADTVASVSAFCQEKGLFQPNPLMYLIGASFVTTFLFLSTNKQIKPWLGLLSPLAFLPGGFILEDYSRLPFSCCVAICGGISMFILLQSLASLLHRRQLHYPIPDESMSRMFLYQRNTARLRRLIMEQDELHHLTGKCVAVYGRWGSGKTHFIHYLKHHLSKKAEGTTDGFTGTFSVAHVDLWSCKDGKDAWQKVLDTLSTAVIGEQRWKTGLLKAILEWSGKVLSVGDAHISEAIAAIIFYGSKEHSGNPIEIVSRKIGFPHSGKGVLLVIDDVERADIKVIRDLLPLLSRLHDIPGLLTVCGISKEDLETDFFKAGYTKEYLHGHLDKLFDFCIDMPGFQPETSSEMLCGYLAKKYPHATKALRYVREHRLRFDSPRQIKIAAACLEKNEVYYMVPSRTEKDFFIALPHSSETNNELIFTVELMRRLYSDVISTFQIAGCYRAIEQYRNDNAIHLINAEAVRQICAHEELKTQCPFLHKERSSSELFCSLFALFLKLYQGNEETILHASYATSSYITAEEGNDIITLIADSDRETDLCTYIPANIRRHFAAGEEIHSALSLLQYVAKGPRNISLHTRAQFLARCIAPTLVKFGVKEQTICLKFLLPTLLKFRQDIPGNNTTSLLINESIEKLLKHADCESLFNFIKEHADYTSMERAMCRELGIQVPLFRQSGLHPSSIVHETLQNLISHLTSHLLQRMDKNPSYPSETDNTILEIMYTSFKENFPMEHKFQKLYMRGSDEHKIHIFFKLLKQIIDAPVLEVSLYRLIDLLDIPHLSPSPKAKSELYRTYYGKFQNLQNAVSRLPQYSSTLGHLLQIAKRQITP